jgi:S1-C subfamily serine protease
MSCRATVVYLIGLATLGIISVGGSLASEHANLAHCYDPTRELVQKVAPTNCEGKTVSPAEAENIRKRIKQQRFERAREAAPRRQRPLAKSSGSGVLLTDAGHIVTAAHVVAGCLRTRVHHPSSPTREARVVARHPTADLALLHVPANERAPIAIAFENAAEPGTGMSTIGYPNQGRTVVRPIRKAARFGGLRTVSQSGAQGPLRIVFQGELRPGNSGGALLDQDERLVGVVIAQIDTPRIYAETGQLIRHVGFAEPIAAVRDLLDMAEVTVDQRSSRSPKNAERSVFRVTCRSGGKLE